MMKFLNHLKFVTNYVENFKNLDYTSIRNYIMWLNILFIKLDFNKKKKKINSKSKEL